jgi:solute:Na+ symporter, SSS family
MASIDSPLNSLTSSFVSDLYRPLLRRHATERHYLLVSRLGVVGFGLLLAGIAAACSPVQNILDFAFQVLSLPGGALLGVFLLGLLTRHRANRANLPAMLVSTVVCTVLLVLIQTGMLKLGWTWLIVIGTSLTMILSYVFALAARTFSKPAGGRMA